MAFRIEQESAAARRGQIFSIRQKQVEFVKKAIAEGTVSDPEFKEAMAKFEEMLEEA